MKTIHLGNTMAITIKCGISNSTPNIRVANELSHAIRIHEISPGSVFCSVCFLESLSTLPIDEQGENVGSINRLLGMQSQQAIDLNKDIVDVEEEQ